MLRILRTGEERREISVHLHYFLLADILAQLHCDELQGFLFARPMSEPTLMKWLGQRGAPAPLASNAVPLDTHEESEREASDIATAWSELEASSP